MTLLERHKAKFAHMNVEHSPVTLASSALDDISASERALSKYTRLTVPAWNVFDSFFTGTGEEKQEEDPMCPLKWWNKQLDVDPDLKPVAQAAFKAFTIRITSTFSEQIFPSAKISTSGQRARTGVVALNRRQFVKYNFPVVEAEFNENKYLLHDKAKYYRDKVADLLKRYELDIEELEMEEQLRMQQEEEADNNSTCTTELASTFVGNFSETKEKWCLSCQHYSLVKMDMKKFPGKVIKCSVEGCGRKTKRVKPNEVFYGCSNCHDWDMCLDCFNE